MNTEFKKNFSLKNKKAIILGASSDIGISCAKFLSNQGAAIFLTSRDSDNLEIIQKKLYGENHRSIGVDLTIPKEQEKLFGELNIFGIPDIIILNWNDKVKPGKLKNINLDEAKITNEINFLLKLIQFCIPSQKEKKFGRWIGISSMIAKFGGTSQAIYTIQKNSLESIMKTLAIEEGVNGITSNIISPGIILTKELKKKLSQEQIEVFSKMNLLERAGLPEEVAFGVSFLASPLSSYINGINLPICGGFDLNWGTSLFLRGKI